MIFTLVPRNIEPPVKHLVSNKSFGNLFSVNSILKFHNDVHLPGEPVLTTNGIISNGMKTQ